MLTFGQALPAQVTISLRDATTVDTIADTAPTRQVQCTDTGVTVTYSFSNAALQSDPLFEGCSMLKIDGFGVNYVPEEPAVLFRSDMFALPAGASAKLSLGDCEYTEFDCQLSPSRQLLPNNTSLGHTRDNVLPIKPYSGLFPAEIASMPVPQCYRGTPLQSVQISPVQYDYERQTVRVYTKLQYILTYDFSSPQKMRDNNANTPAYISPSDNFISNLTLNSASLRASGPARAPVTEQNDTKDYLIITTPYYKEAAQTLAEWKKLLGFRTHIIARNDWTPDTVKSEVRKFYANHPALYYLLIIGGHKDVPAMKGTAPRPILDSYVTDYRYGCIADSTLQEIACGRIPVSNDLIAKATIQKIVDYEKNPLLDSGFYNTGLHCSQFQDENFDGSEDRRFVQTSEDIYNFMNTFQHKTINRVYFAEPTVNPSFWNNNPYSTGGSIPDYLKRPGFKWDGSTEHIIDHINQGTFYVLHTGHGMPLGWGNPSFTSTDVSNLNNGKKLPVFFNMNCETGKFDYRFSCFAEDLLNHGKGGCIGIFAASSSSLSGINDALACGMINAIWPSPILSPDIKDVFTGEMFPSTIECSPTYALGDISNQGKWRAQERIRDATSSYWTYTKYIFHCFGDPSMQIITETPTPFNEIKIFRAGSVSVRFANLDDDPARITFYDHSNGEVYSTVATHTIYHTDHPEMVDVCVSAHNKIPYISQGPVYLQGERVRGDKLIVAKSIFAGSNVTPYKLPGQVTFVKGNITLRAGVVEFSPGVRISTNDINEFRIEFRTPKNE